MKFLCPQGRFDKKSLELYKMSSSVVIERTNKKGMTKKIDLKEAVRRIRPVISGQTGNGIIVRAGKNGKTR